MSFATVETVSAFMNKEVIDLTPLELTQINLLIPQVDGIITNYCGWNMLATDYTNKRYDGNGLNSLDLRVYPINFITSLRMRDSGGTYTDYDPTTVEILEGGVIQFDPAVASGSSFTFGTSNIFVSFNAGYEEIPGDIEYAANYLVSLNLKKIMNEMMGVESGRFNDVEVRFDSLELPIMVKRVLDRFRLISIF